MLNVDRIVGQYEFLSEYLGPIRWLEDGSGYTMLENPPGAHVWVDDIVLYDPSSGERKVLVPSSKLKPFTRYSPLYIKDYYWSQDGKRVLIFTNTERVWRENTRGDYYVYNLETEDLHQLGWGADPSQLMFAKFSPQGDRVAYVCYNNIYVEDLESYEIQPLTEDGSDLIINGNFDWVYEEEFRIRDGFRWSPDGTKIAYWRLDSTAVPVYTLVNNTDELYPTLTCIPIPKAGQCNSHCSMGVVDVSGGDTVWMCMPEGMDMRNHYIARMEWAGSSDAIVFQRLNRLQNVNEIVLGSAETGETFAMHAEQDDAWLDPVDGLKWIDDGKAFTWLSEKTGWQHLYKVSRNGRTIEPITSGEFDVISVEHIDANGGWAYFIASPDNPTQRYLYRASLNEPGEPERLTPEGLDGVHSYEISPDAKWAIHRWSSVGVPYLIDVVSLPDHKSHRTLEDHAKLKEKLSKLKKGPEGFLRIDIGDGIELDAHVIKPPDFDPSKKYPVLFHVYGYPGHPLVVDRWVEISYVMHRMFAQQGYVVVTVDNRGTRSPRGRLWRKCLHQKLGILPHKEQAAATRKIIAQFPWVDEKRIGVYGHSGGGTLSLNLIFRYPKLYRMAMAVAPVTDQRYYDTIYQERFIGLPQENEEIYKEGSPITYAHQLEGELLLIHGTGDDNCHYQHTEALINKLIEHNKPFTMMAYPNRTHDIYDGGNSFLHMFSLMTRFLNEKLPVQTEE